MLSTLKIQAFIYTLQPPSVESVNEDSRTWVISNHHNWPKSQSNQKPSLPVYIPDQCVLEKYFSGHEYKYAHTHTHAFSAQWSVYCSNDWLFFSLDRKMKGKTSFIFLSIVPQSVCVCVWKAKGHKERKREIWWWWRKIKVMFYFSHFSVGSLSNQAACV